MALLFTVLSTLPHLISLIKDYVKRLLEKNKARAYINNTNEEMLEYHRIFGKKIKPLPREPQLPDFFHPPEAQRNGELLFVVVGTGIATYALYKYLE